MISPSSHRLPTAPPPVSFSCFHGEKEKRPPGPSDDDDIVGKSSSIEELYRQATSRLPLGEMPKLEFCVYAGGNCLGLADHVANIILNAVGLLLLYEQGPLGLGIWSCKGPYPAGFGSLLGLEAFMAAYFRYLSATQTRRYLSLSSNDLSLAIRLGHRHDSFVGRGRRLLPDGGRIKAALRLAAAKAKHPAPGVLAVKFSEAQERG